MSSRVKMKRRDNPGSQTRTHVAAFFITFCLVGVLHRLAVGRSPTGAELARLSKPGHQQALVWPAGTAHAATAAEHAGRPEPSGRCHAMKFVEISAGQVLSHAGLHTTTPGECCDACLKHVPTTATATCNVWSWFGEQALCGGQHGQCILKHVPPPHSHVPTNVGPTIGWMSGIVASDAEQPQTGQSLTASAQQGTTTVANNKGNGGPSHTRVRKYHTIATHGEGIYSAWIMRIHYYWFRKIKDECERTLGPACEMGGFTRILHTGQPDDLMDEIPTWVAQSYSQEDVTAYPPVNRPWSILQWILQANIPEDFILIGEADQIFIRPMPNLMGDSLQLVGPKVYFLKPSSSTNLPLIAQFLPSKNLTYQEAANFPNAGNSPVFITKEQLRKLAPHWHDLNIRILKEPSVQTKWNWMREMYAFIIAVHVTGLGQLDVSQPIVALPPYDTFALGMKSPSGGDYYTVHYSYAFDYAPNGTFTPEARGAWHFHKRDYQYQPPPRHIPAPPSFVQNDMIRTVINMINEATANIPCWDEYVKSKRKPATCDEVITSK